VKKRNITLLPLVAPWIVAALVLMSAFLFSRIDPIGRDASHTSKIVLKPYHGKSRLRTHSV
jgi:hypothetical protein